MYHTEIMAAHSNPVEPSSLQSGQQFELRLDLTDELQMPWDPVL